MKVELALSNTTYSKARNNSVIKNPKNDPVSQLAETFGTILWKTKLVAGVHNKCRFTVSTIVDGNRFRGTGTTLKTAKRLCALKALNQILEEKCFDHRKSCIDCKATASLKCALYPINEEIAEPNSMENKKNGKLLVLQNITNLELNSNLKTAGKNRIHKITNEKSNTRLFINELFWKVLKPAADLGNINQDNVVNLSFLPITLENTDNNSCVVNENIGKLETYREQYDQLLEGNEHVSDDTFSNNTMPIVIDGIKDDCNLPSSSHSSRNLFNTNLKHFGSQAKYDIIDAKPVMTEINSLSDLRYILSNNLNVVKSTTQNSSSRVDMINGQAIETGVCIKSFIKIPIVDTNVLLNQVGNGTQSFKRCREESRESPAKIRATGTKNCLSKQRQWCQQTNAIQDLKKLLPNLNFTSRVELGNSIEPYFMVSAIVFNRKFYGHGKTKNLAEKDAAIKILSSFEKNSDLFMNNERSPRFPKNSLTFQHSVLHSAPNNEVCSLLLLQSNYADVIESKINYAFDKLTCGHEEFSRYTVLAGIIMTFHMNFDNAMVISIATGTKCVNGGNICCNGSVLNDSHAEVIAKRGLMKFLFNQLKKHCNSYTMEDSVFENTPIGYKLKPFVHFHLYINTAPCGDGRVFNFNHTYSPDNMFQTSFNNLQYGQLRTKVEGELGTTPIDPRFYTQTWDGIVLGEPLHTMSCSDKIALWNVVGIQGALLSQFVEPIYLHSITLGSLFNAQHMYRAICGRIHDTLGYLPEPYNLNRPLLGQTSKLLRRRHTFKAPSTGINWTCGDNDIEIISLPAGRSINNKTSFLSKQAFFFKYFYLCNNLPNLRSAPVSNIYAEAKQIAQDYQYAKREVFAAFHRANLGNWVKKPKEQNEFTMTVI